MIWRLQNAVPKRVFRSKPGAWIFNRKKQHRDKTGVGLAKVENHPTFATGSLVFPNRSFFGFASAQGKRIAQISGPMDATLRRCRERLRPPHGQFHYRPE